MFCTKSAEMPTDKEADSWGERGAGAKDCHVQIRMWHRRRQRGHFPGVFRILLAKRILYYIFGSLGCLYLCCRTWRIRNVSVQLMRALGFPLCLLILSTLHSSFIPHSPHMLNYCRQVLSVLKCV